MDSRAASEDLAFLRSVLDRTQRRLDPHAFHFVSWGAIVLVWFPLQNWLQLHDAPAPWQLAVPLASLVLGILVGTIGERRLNRRSDLPPEDTFLVRQVLQAVWGALVPAIVLSVLGPALSLFSGEYAPIVWGFAYAAMAWTMGVVYSAEFRWGAVWIFAGCVVAMAVPDHAGIVLGPAMGLGLLVPGLVAMRRVRAQRTVVAGRSEAGDGA